MLFLVSDENFNNDIVRGLLRRNPDLDLVRVQDVGLRGADDPTILGWAARENRVVLTHDAATMADFAYQRVRDHQPMPGVIEIADDLPLGIVIEDVLFLAEYSEPNEWDGQVLYLPL